MTSGAIDATEVIAGKAIARYIPTLANLPQGGALGLAVQVAAALAAGYVGRYISPNASKMMLAGGLAAPIESFVKSLNLPIISGMLGDSEGFYAVGAWPGVSGYVAPGAGALAGEDDAADAVYGY